MELNRKYTPDEMRRFLLRNFNVMAHYWAKDANVKSELERCQGLIHSILVTLDGQSGLGASFDIVASETTPEDIEYCKEADENWWGGSIFEDGKTVMLHDEWGEMICADSEARRIAYIFRKFPR